MCDVCEELLLEKTRDQGASPGGVYPDHPEKAVSTLVLAGLDPSATDALSKARAAILLNRLDIVVMPKWRAWITEPDNCVQRVAWLKTAEAPKRAAWWAAASEVELKACERWRHEDECTRGLSCLHRSHPSKAPAKRRPDALRPRTQSTRYRKAGRTTATVDGRRCASSLLLNLPVGVQRFMLARLDRIELRRAAGVCATLRHLILGDACEKAMARAWFLNLFGCDDAEPATVDGTDVRESAIEGLGLFARHAFSQGDFIGEFCGALDTGHTFGAANTFALGEYCTDWHGNPVRSPYFLNPMCLHSTSNQDPHRTGSAANGDQLRASMKLAFANHSCEPNMRACVVNLEAFGWFDGTGAPSSRSCERERSRSLLHHPLMRSAQNAHGYDAPSQTVLFFATRSIRPSEELTYEYNERRVSDFRALLRRVPLGQLCTDFEETFGTNKIPCNCKAAACNGSVFGCHEYWDERRRRWSELFAQFRANTGRAG